MKSATRPRNHAAGARLIASVLAGRFDDPLPHELSTFPRDEAFALIAATLTKQQSWFRKRRASIQIWILQLERVTIACSVVGAVAISQEIMLGVDSFRPFLVLLAAAVAVGAINMISIKAFLKKKQSSVDRSGSRWRNSPRPSTPSSY